MNPPTTDQVSHLTQLIAAIAGVDLTEATSPTAQRGLLEAFNAAKHTAWQTVIKVITTGILAALLVGAAIKLKVMGGGQ